MATFDELPIPDDEIMKFAREHGLQPSEVRDLISGLSSMTPEIRKQLTSPKFLDNMGKVHEMSKKGEISEFQKRLNRKLHN
jgi:hypothetical protein